MTEFEMYLAEKETPVFEFNSLLDDLSELTSAMEAPVDVTGETEEGTRSALGANARTTDQNSNRGDINTTDMDSPGDLLTADDPDNPNDDEESGEEGGEGNEDENTDEETEGEEGEGEEGGSEDEGDLGGESPEPDASNDSEVIKKARLKENLIDLHRIIQKNTAMLAKCNVSTISTITGNANAKVIRLLRDTGDIIYELITDGKWDNTPYPQLMQKYVGLNMVFDIAVKMLNENVTAAEKDREADIRAAKRLAKKVSSQNTIKVQRDNLRGYNGIRPSHR